MTQEELILAEVSSEQLAQLTKEELIIFVKGEQSLRLQLQRDNERLRALYEETKQKTLLIGDELVVMKGKLFGKSSERSLRRQANNGMPAKTAKVRVLLPSERYPNAPLIERDITFEKLPNCGCCSSEMQDSGMTEDSEFLTVIPQQYLVIRQKRHKYRCTKCHGDIKTAPAPKRIKEGSAYSDEMVIDASLSKYCDLIPIERYCAIAGRAGLKDLPPQSLIEGSHDLAECVRPAYDLAREEVLASTVFSADETPHRMLEGDKKTNWFLWGFASDKASYFEAHDTRSGDVASNLLLKSKCQFLVSDGFSGYGKAVKDINKVREQENLPKIVNVFCNAHARRKFKDALLSYKDEAQFYIDQYQEIYRLEGEVKGQPPNEVLEKRGQMAVFFESMKNRAMANRVGYSSKSSLGRAMAYFLENFDGFTLFLKNAILPIDNNPQERLLRNPVIGRKTWYGTHSRRGADTAAILFTLVESCKLNGVNPRQYFKKLVDDLNNGRSAFTPSQFNNLPN